MSVSPLMSAALLLCVGCVGSFGVDGDPSTANSNGENPGVFDPGTNDVETPIEAATCAEVGPRLVRRLSSAQYRNTLQAIFSNDLGFDAASMPSAQVLTDPTKKGFDIDANDAVIRDLGAQQVMVHAEKVARWAVENHLSALSSCSDLDDGQCRTSFIDAFGQRVYRKPLTAEQQAAYDALMREEATFADGVEIVVSTMLQSPHFLYRLELGEPVAGQEKTYALTPFELATNLAYTLTNAPPDQALIEAAQTGALETDTELRAQFERLVSTPQAQENLARFVQKWLMIEDLTARAKDETEVSFPTELRESMIAETTSLYAEAFESGAGLAQLFTADHTYLDDRLRQFYGVWSSAEGDANAFGLSRTPLASARAGGILAHGSVLSRHALSFSSSPVLRGLLVRERLLCLPHLAPPEGVDTNVSKDAVAGLTTRERYQEHATNDACKGCHSQIDPIGFTFEHYDAFGRYREQDVGQPIDASGGIPGNNEVGTLDGLGEMSAYLAQSPEVHACYQELVSYYATGLEGCAPSLDSQASLKDVMLEVVVSDHFRHRKER